MLDGQPRRLNELSSGFASLIKIVQSIVAGYGFLPMRMILKMCKDMSLLMK